MFAMNVILKHVCVVVLNLAFCSIYAICRKFAFVAIYALFRVKFLPKNSGRVNLLTNIMSEYIRKFILYQLLKHCNVLQPVRNSLKTLLSISILILCLVAKLHMAGQICCLSNALSESLIRTTRKTLFS